MGRNTVIVDGDLIAYRFAAAGEERKINVKHIKSGREKLFKTRTAFKDFLAADGKEYKPEAYEITDVQSLINESATLSTIEKFMEKLEEFTWADSIEVYLGTGKTFRHDLPLPTPYKSNRDGLKPLLLDKSRNVFIKKYGAKLVTDIEVDDYVTIRAYEELAKGNSPILVSSDKDSQQTQGVQVLNWLKDPWELKMIPDTGSLYKEKAIVKGDGLMFLALQTLAGDTADTYCGYDLSEVKYGPTKAMNALKDATTEKQILEIMISEFKTLYPKEFEYTDCHGVTHKATWKTMLELYWKCAYMMRSHDDKQDFASFARERGVEYDN
jgi:hypothetical protein